jgi:hypothetical protein
VEARAVYRRGNQGRGEHVSDDDVKNLLEETIQDLKASSLTLQDVRWWGTAVASYPLEDLERLERRL